MLERIAYRKCTELTVLRSVSGNTFNTCAILALVLLCLVRFCASRTELEELLENIHDRIAKDLFCFVCRQKAISFLSHFAVVMTKLLPTLTTGGHY